MNIINLENLTKQELRLQAKKLRIKGFSKMKKAELITVLEKYRNKNYKGCRHRFGSVSFHANQGIVFATYECEKCGEEFTKMIGETWRPDQFGNW